MSFNKYRTKGAFHYEWYETEDWYKYLIDRAVKFCSGSTVDIGGGDGLFATLHGDTVVYDNDPEAIKILSDRSIPFRNIDIDNIWLTGAEAKYEYLACINSIEHFNKPENVKKIIKEQVTKGAIIITIDYQGGELGEDHKHEYTMDELIDFFKEFNPKPFRYKDTEWIGVEISK